MARKLGRQTTRARVKVVSQSGRPPATVDRSSFVAKLPRLPQYSKRRIRMLQKVDVSKGITMPEADNMTTVAGITPMGAQVTTISRQQPNIPAAPTKNLRVTKPPRPGQGYLKTFNRVARIRNTSIRKK